MSSIMANPVRDAIIRCQMCRVVVDHTFELWDWRTQKPIRRNVGFTFQRGDMDLGPEPCTECGFLLFRLERWKGVAYEG